MSASPGQSANQQLQHTESAPDGVRVKAFPRRGLITGAVGAAAAATGGALGYKFRATIDSMRTVLTGRTGAGPVELSIKTAVPQPSFSEVAEQDFHTEARRIHERHRQQTVETVAALKKKYEKPVFGRMHVWDLIEKLGQCVDLTDHKLCGASQLLHMQQALAAMEQHGVDDPDLFLIALIHDLGKVFLLAGEVPENVFCPARRLGEYPPGIGLEQMTCQFGHAELIYSRVKGLVPEHVAWTVRNHNLDLDDVAEFMNERDQEFADKYLVVFRTFDRNFKSQHWVPPFDAAKYRELVQRYFPAPILF